MKHFQPIEKIADAATAPTHVEIYCRFHGGTAHVPKELLPKLPSMCCVQCANRMQALADGGTRWPEPTQRPHQPNIFERLFGR